MGKTYKERPDKYGYTPGKKKKRTKKPVKKIPYGYEKENKEERSPLAPLEPDYTRPPFPPGFPDVVEAWYSPGEDSSEPQS